MKKYIATLLVSFIPFFALTGTAQAATCCLKGTCECSQDKKCDNKDCQCVEKKKQCSCKGDCTCAQKAEEGKEGCGCAK